VIAVLGSEYDGAARALVQAWSAYGAVLVGAQDLCTRGWVLHAPAQADGAFVADGRIYPVERLLGVVVRRPAVAAEELPWIALDDRHYAMAEVNAFLVAWLAALRCQVFNRPSASSLCGPAWSQTHWQIAAARAGVRWCATPTPAVAIDVVFCRGQSDVQVSKAQRRAADALARRASVDLLGIRFAGDEVAAVTLQPALTSDAARALVLAQLGAAVAA